MIPLFPKFKAIKLEDGKSIRKYAAQHHPYSDFNFTNLWMWDTTRKRKISMLNGNLVVLFTDYLTNEPFLSFLGSRRCEETARALIDFARATGISPVLRFVTEESLPELRKTSLNVEEDNDSFDYVYKVSRLADPLGNKLKEKRHLANRFPREYPNAKFESRALNDSVMQGRIVSVVRRWENRKKYQNKAYNLEHEERAIHRLLTNARTLGREGTLILSGVFLNEEMLGFSVDEVVSDNYAISHLIKADNSYKGIYEFINERVAEHLAANNVKFWNWQQDLGIKGLRDTKKSYGPVHFLKKYSVSDFSRG